MEKFQVVLVLCFLAIATATSPKELTNKLYKYYAQVHLMENCIGEKEVENIHKALARAVKTCYHKNDQATQQLQLQQQQHGHDQQQHGQYHQQHGQYHQQQPVTQYGGYNNQFGGYQQQPQYYPYYQPSPYHAGYYHSHGRMKRSSSEAKDFFMDKFTKYFDDKVGNITCILQLQGMINEDLEVNYNKIKREYPNSFPPYMRKEVSRSIDQCRQITQCVPDSLYDDIPFGESHGEIFTFFKCLGKKSRALCLKKEMVEDYEQYKHKMVENSDDMNEGVHDAVVEFFYGTEE